MLEVQKTVSLPNLNASNNVSQSLCIHHTKKTHSTVVSVASRSWQDLLTASAQICEDYDYTGSSPL